MSVISHTNLQELCRACLRTLKENNLNTSDGDPSLEAGEDGRSHLKNLLLPNLCKLFMFLTTYDVNNENEDFPKRLCEWCYDRLLDYEEFRKLAVKSTEILYERWNANRTREILMEEKRCGESADPIKRIKQEEDEELDDNQLLLPELANMPINIKTELIFEAMDTQYIMPTFVGEKEMNGDQTSYKFYNNEQDASNHKLLLPNSIVNNSSQSFNSSDNNVNLEEDKIAKNLHCNDCNKNFYKEIYLEAHIRVSHMDQKKPLECSICTKAFTRFHLLSEHMKSKHNEEFISTAGQIEDTQENQLKIDHFCYMCRRKYSSKRALKEHIKRHKKIKEHVCKECGVAKVTRTELITHMRTHTPNLEKFPCPQCPQVFNHKNAISRHVKVIHEGLRRFQCSYCPKRFGTRNSQVCHERLHTGERPFTCEICKKGFVQQEGLKSHMKNHDTSLRKHVCKFCSRRFITLKNLKDHERRHSSEKPHICNICSKGFSKYDELRVHYLTHTDEDTPGSMLDTIIGV